MSANLQAKDDQPPVSQGIRSLQDLRLEEQRVRLRIRMREEELAARLKKLPGEALSAGAQQVVPAFLRGRLASAGLGAAGSLAAFIFSKKDVGKSLGATVVKPLLKRVGVATAVKLAYNLFMKKKGKPS